MIWFDRTQRSVLVGCSSCGQRHLAGTQAQADTWAAGHLTTHDERNRAQVRAVWASQKRRQRDTP